MTELCRRAIPLREGEISIERHDDLAIARVGDRELCLEQLKHSMHAGTISENSPDWWSAIDVWLQDPQLAVKRRLVTTDAIASGSKLGECYRPNTIAPWSKLVDAMEGIATSPPNTKFAARGTYAKWRGLRAPTKRRFLESISVLDRAPNLKETIFELDKAIQAEGVPAEAIVATRNSYVGAVVALVSVGLDSTGATIPCSTMRGCLVTAMARALEAGHYDLPEVAIDQEAIEELRTSKMLHMIPQLKAIKRDEDRLVVKALEIWFGARHHRDRLMNGTPHSLMDLRAHDRDIISYCDNEHARHTGAPQLEYESIGQRIYHACMSQRARLGKSDAPLVFAQGSYYELSNDLRVRWHPKYGEEES